MGSRLLIVCHGRGRGRDAGFIGNVLDDVAQHAPALRKAIRVHPTGRRDPPDLSEVGTILFWLADPLREMYPDCFAEAAEIARRARDGGVRLANPPEALSNSIKSVQAALWSAAGISTPRHCRFQTRAELDEQAAGLSYPVLLKADMLHSQARMRFCRSADEIRSLPADALAMPGSAASFVDTREGYRTTRPKTIWAHFFHKKRVIVLGDILHPRHTIFSQHPIVGLKNSTIMRHGGAASRPLLPGDAVAHACIDADNAFWTGAPEKPELMRAACRALGIDTAAIDYSTFADGSVVLWEANPYFYLFARGDYILPKERRFEERHQAFIGAFRRFLENLVDPSGAQQQDRRVGEGPAWSTR